jgi:hypothetical protein
MAPDDDPLLLPKQALFTSHSTSMALIESPPSAKKDRDKDEEDAAAAATICGSAKGSTFKIMSIICWRQD